MTTNKTTTDQSSRVIAKLAKYRQDADKFRERRDALVCEAWEAGVPVPVIASMIGISAPRVYQIKEGR